MPGSPPYSKEEVLAELDALVAPKAFRRSPGLVVLLRYVVESELRGEGHDLKETLLGNAVYFRNADYDTRRMASYG
jgi:hypothetical protein